LFHYGKIKYIFFFSQTAQDNKSYKKTAQAANLVEIVSTTEGFSTLTAALKAASLIDTLSGGEFFNMKIVY